MKISILGATGSIGLQTIEVIRECLPQADIVALTGFSNIDALKPLVNEFKPKYVWVLEQHVNSLQGLGSEVLSGEDGLDFCASESGADIVINALVGRAGLKPTLAAINKGIDIALANKETLVTAGELLMPLAREKNARITPIDSEHSAIWQCLQGNDINTVEKILLTASGGPFRSWSRERILKEGSASAALKHPNWSMGAKITVDSATLMNKGLELIEAMWLFNMPLDCIQILIHPQSIIHSMVEYVDGSVVAQMGLPDMRLPILYALTGPKRIHTPFTKTDFLKLSSLTFEEADTETFPCLALARHSATVAGTLPAVMNYINEWAVGEYLQDRLGFYDISRLIEKAFGLYCPKPVTSIESIVEAENWAKEFIGALPPTPLLPPAGC